jgi:hypothetical protein
MPLDVLLLVLRIATALALYAFLAALFAFLWRDVRAASRLLAAEQRPLGRLIVVACNDDLPLAVGQTFPLRPYTTIGRGTTNTVVLPDGFVSSEHATLVQRGGQWWLDDKQSRNGTTVNDLVVTEPVVLSPDDEIGIGRIKLRLELTQ